MDNTKSTTVGPIVIEPELTFNLEVIRIHTLDSLMLVLAQDNLDLYNKDSMVLSKQWFKDNFTITEAQLAIKNRELYFR